MKLVEQTLEERIVPDVPERLIGDKAYDSDGLDKKLMENFGTEMIAPNRAKRKQTQDGRPLRRYVRRWKVERMFAWLFNFRRLVVRYEYHIANFNGFLQLAAAVIGPTARHVARTLLLNVGAIGLKARHVIARPEGPGKRPPKITPAL